MYAAHLVKGCQPDDGDAAAWRTGNTDAVAEGTCRSKDGSFAIRPVVGEQRLSRFVGRSLFEVSLHFSLPAAGSSPCA